MLFHRETDIKNRHISINTPKKFPPDVKFLFLLLILFTVMIFSLCFQDTINYDEYFSMQWCRLSWRELMQTLISDVHPPLYYLLLKPFVDLSNESMICARILSAICGIALLWIGALFLSSHFGTKPALFYSCFLYLNPFMIQKTTEIRMYMLASLFTVMSGIFSYLLLTETSNMKKFSDYETDVQIHRASRKYWGCFTLSSLLAAYTHYYALLVMCFLYAGLAICFICTRNKKAIISWLLCATCTVIAYLPWLPTALRQLTAVNQAYWISMPTSRLAPLRELFYSAIPYSEHIYLCVICFLIAYAFIMLVKEKSIDSYWTLMCSSALCGIMLFSIWYTSHVRPILVSRYLIMAICLCILGISNITRFLNKYVVMLLCLFCFFVGGVRYQSALFAQANRITTKTVNFVTEHGTTNDCFIYVNDGYGYLAHCVEYYFPNALHIGIEKEALSALDMAFSESNGFVWFLDDQEYLSDIPEDSAHFVWEDCGIYGFGSSGFRLYKLLPK